MMRQFPSLCGLLSHRGAPMVRDLLSHRRSGPPMVHDLLDVALLVFEEHDGGSGAGRTEQSTWRAAG